MSSLPFCYNNSYTKGTQHAAISNHNITIGARFLFFYTQRPYPLCTTVHTSIPVLSPHDFTMTFMTLNRACCVIVGKNWVVRSIRTSLAMFLCPMKKCRAGDEIVLSRKMGYSNPYKRLKSLGSVGDQAHLKNFFAIRLVKKHRHGMFSKANLDEELPVPATYLHRSIYG